MNKKIISIFIVILFIFSSFTNVYAAEIKTTLKIVQDVSEKGYLNDSQGYFEKRITSINGDTGELTVQLNINNNNQQETEVTRYEETEIYIMVYEGIVNDTEKMTEYTTYIETLSNNILATNDKTKIGIIGIQGTIADYTINEEGNRVNGENDESVVKGSADNTEIVANLTDNISELMTQFKQMNNEKKSYYSNLQAAIRLANNSYSNNVNKILISLYDGVPKICIGEKSQISYGGILSIYETAEEAANAKYKAISSNTKSEILKLKTNNVDFILLRPDDTSYDNNYYNSETGEFSFSFDGSPYVKELYGTLENPTHGKMYSLNNDSLEDIVTNYIYKDVIETIGSPINDVTVKDYFTDDILNNFDIEISSSNIDASKLESEGFIQWSIDNIEANKSATLEYKLKIKDMNNTELLNKIIDIGEKAEITYTDYADLEQSKELTNSPKIQLVEVNETDNQTSDTNIPKTDDKEDLTVAPGTLPYAGVGTTIITVIEILVICAIIACKKYNKLSDIK